MDLPNLPPLSDIIRDGYALEELVFSSPKSFKVQVPARIGFCVRDMATFKQTKFGGGVGGGGVGMAIDLYSETVVSVLPPSAAPVESPSAHDHHLDIYGCKRTAIAKHHVHVFRKCLESIGVRSYSPFIIQHKEAFRDHCGLGSTSSLALGIYIGLNKCYGEPFTLEGIRQMLLRNYVEETADSSDEVQFGYETSMTATGAIGGGMYLIDPTTLDIIVRNTVAFEGLKVYLFDPVQATTTATGTEDTSSSTSASPTATAAAEAVEEEEAVVLAEGAISDAHEDEVAKKTRIFDTILLPQLQADSSCDLDVVGGAIFSLNMTGGKRVEIEKKKDGHAIVSFIESVKRDVAHVSIVGMSSIGPMVAVVCSNDWSVESDLPQLKQIAEEKGFNLFAATSVNCTGCRSEERKWPGSVPVLGLPCAGKTFICEKIGVDNVLHFPAGQVLRDFVKANPEHPDAVELAAIMREGEVEDKHGVATRRLLLALSAMITTDTTLCLLDGFPRSVDQLKSLLAVYRLPVAMVAHVRVSDETRQQNATKRGATRGSCGEPGEPVLHDRDAKDQTDLIVAAAHEMGIPVVEVHCEEELRSALADHLPAVKLD